MTESEFMGEFPQEELARNGEKESEKIRAVLYRLSEIAVNDYIRMERQKLRENLPES